LQTYSIRRESSVSGGAGIALREGSISGGSAINPVLESVLGRITQEYERRLLMKVNPKP
jgi:hypothetical protein